jgi:hypothetical protein
VIDREKWPDRAARSDARGAGGAGGDRDAMKAEEEPRQVRQSEEAFFCDWSTHGEGKLVETGKGAEKTGCKVMMDTGGKWNRGLLR